MKWNPETAQETRIHPVTKKLEKKCSKCGGVKPVEYFSPMKKAATGFNSHCRRCMNIRQPTGMKSSKYSNISMTKSNRNNK